MNPKLLLVPTLLSIVLIGCKTEKDSAVSAPATKPETTTVSSAKPSDTLPADKVAPKESDIPAELKHDGYSYYGLSNLKPMDMVATYSSNPGKMTGSQITTLKSIKDGKAVFYIERTGNLADLGTQEVSLEKDGIYVTASSVAKVNHDLEIPAKLSPGVSWSNKMIVDDPMRKVDMTSVFKVVGERKIKTKVGERTALLITSSGSGMMRGEKVKLDSQNWYVRDVGGVKSVIKIVHSNGKSETVTIEEGKQ